MSVKADCRQLKSRALIASTSYAPSEATIEAAIQRQIGNPGFFQRVAEQLARGLYPNLPQTPFGRRPDDKTVAGWPDAYLTKADGRLIAVEATTADSASSVHWSEDLSKISDRLASERRGGLVWVAWVNPASPTTAVEMREQASRLGLPQKDVHIFFRKDICNRLRAAFHARFWINDLGLQATSSPFDSIRSIIDRARFRRSTGIFPTLEEYDEDRVYAPPALGEIEKALTERQAAMAVGHGAAGKTTLAMVLAHRPRFRHAPTYYLDLTAASTDPTLTERAAAAFTTIADRGVLFVVDNAHLDTRAAVRLFEQWRDFGAGSELLILTRRIRARAEVWEDALELEALPVPRVDVTIEPADLSGVYNRHYLARHGREAPDLKAEILDRWHKLFGGDLLVFSAAVLGLLGRDGEEADLQIADARRFVRERYLQDAAMIPERAALLDLAAVAEVEGLIPVEAFAGDALKECVRRGLVWVETRDAKGAYALYRLAHPGLGTLLRDAADCTTTSREDRVRLLRQHKYVCVALALRLRKTGESSEAIALLEAFWNSAEWPLGELPVLWWRSALVATQEMGLVPAGEVSARANAWFARSENRAALVQRVLATPLHFLQSFLSYAARSMPMAATIAREGLKQEARLLVKHALASPLDHLRPFLSYADKAMPEAADAIRYELEKEVSALVRQALSAPLGDVSSFLAYADTAMPTAAVAIRDRLEKEVDGLADQALETPLNDLPSFFVYADAAMPATAKAIRHRLENKMDDLQEHALATPLNDLATFLTFADRAMRPSAKIIRDRLGKDVPGLVERVLATPLSDLVAFLAYVDKAMPTTAKALLRQLEREMDRVVQQMLATPLDHLASFLAYADTRMPRLRQEAQKALLSENLLPVLTMQALHAGPDKITTLCKFDPAFARIFVAMDAEAWSRRWSNVHQGQPNWFTGFALSCYRAGRDVLVGPIADAIIRSARREDFPSPGITIRHLSFLLASPHRCTPDEVDALFSRCLPADWLARQYMLREAAVVTLAGAVHALNMDERTWIAMRLRDPALLSRADLERAAIEGSPRRMAEWLCLFSAIRLLDRAATPLLPTDRQLVCNALSVYPPGPPDQAIQPIQALIWAGLRDWCHLTGQRIVVDPALAEGILAQFQAADTVGRPRRTAMHALLIDWLQRCRAEAWNLVVEREPLLDAIERQVAVQGAAAFPSPLVGERGQAAPRI